MESSEQISTEQELTPAQKILAQGIENFSPSCIVCKAEVPAKRARSRSKDTCSPECNQVLKKFRKHVMVSAHCPACYHPSTPQERAAFIKWRKERGDRRERPGKPPKKKPELERPKIVCLCGSTRFYEKFVEANYLETMAGNIVLSVGFAVHSSEQAHGEKRGCTSEQKIKLDELHKRKIDLADEVFVLNVGGYIGESTASEIKHAVATGKPVRYLEAIDGKS